MRRIIMALWLVMLGIFAACSDEGAGVPNSVDVGGIGRVLSDAGMEKVYSDDPGAQLLQKLEAGTQAERDGAPVVDMRIMDTRPMDMIVAMQSDATAAPDSIPVTMMDARIVPSGEPVIPNYTFIVFKKIIRGVTEPVEYFGWTGTRPDDQEINLLTNCSCDPGSNSTSVWGSACDLQNGSKSQLTGRVIARPARKDDYGANDLMIRKCLGCVAVPSYGQCAVKFIEDAKGFGHYVGTLEQVRTGSRCTCQ